MSEFPDRLHVHVTIPSFVKCDVAACVLCLQVIFKIIVNSSAVNICTIKENSVSYQLISVQKKKVNKMLK